MVPVRLKSAGTYDLPWDKAKTMRRKVKHYREFFGDFGMNVPKEECERLLRMDFHDREFIQRRMIKEALSDDV